MDLRPANPPLQADLRRQRSRPRSASALSLPVPTAVPSAKAAERLSVTPRPGARKRRRVRRRAPGWRSQSAGASASARRRTGRRVAGRPPPRRSGTACRPSDWGRAVPRAGLGWLARCPGVGGGHGRARCNPPLQADEGRPARLLRAGQHRILRSDSPSRPQPLAAERPSVLRRSCYPMIADDDWRL